MQRKTKEPDSIRVSIKSLLAPSDGISIFAFPMIPFSILPPWVFPNKEPFCDFQEIL